MNEAMELQLQSQASSHRRLEAILVAMGWRIFNLTEAVHFPTSSTTCSYEVLC